MQDFLLRGLIELETVSLSSSEEQTYANCLFHHWKLFSLLLLAVPLFFPAPVQAVDQSVLDDLKYGCQFAYYPDDNTLSFQCDFGRSLVRSREAADLGSRCRNVRVQLFKQGDTTALAERQLQLRGGRSAEVSLDVPKLQGEYEVHFTLLTQGEPVMISKPLVRKQYAWEGNTLGITEKIYPPFEPVRVQGRQISVLQRRYRMNGFGMWDSVVTKNREILAGPMTIRYRTAAGEAKWYSPVVTLDTQLSKPTQAVYHGRVKSSAIEVMATSTTEIDGCMKVEMDLLHGARPARVQQLWLEIPLKDLEAPLFHEVADTLRKNYSGVTPSGQGVIWDSNQSYRNGAWRNPFTSYIWLGAEERGLCWFGENDKGWITEKNLSSTPLQTISREGNRLILRVYLINTPFTLLTKRSLVFGLQASPTKSMPVDWRMKVDNIPGHSGPVNPWGGLHCGYKGPFRNDWQIIDKIIAAQKGAPFDEAWFKDYAAKYNPPPAYGTWDWVESVKYFAGQRQRPILTYQEEMHQSHLQEEWFTFQDQWGMMQFTPREWEDESVMRKGVDAGPASQVNYCRSYQDYSLSFANEWFKRGVGAYWDNTYPKFSLNTHTSAAYVTEDGHVQPAVILWNQREYMKRNWNLLCYWREHQSEPLEWSNHMSTTLLLPLQTWGTTILDYELNYDVPYPADMHRTEAIGRQVGCYANWLYPPSGIANPLILDLQKTDPAAVSRIDWGMRAVHEAVRDKQGAQERQLIAFGYGNPAVAVHNYWEDEPVITVDNDQVHWLVLARPQDNTLLLVLQSWLPTTVTPSVKLHAKTIGFLPGNKYSDLETHTALPLAGKSFRVDLTGPYGTKMILIETEKRGI